MRRGTTMTVIGRITRAGFACLTALTTLVAGLPHFQCQCPNGAIKPFCLGVFCSSSGCCCGDACSGTPKNPRCNAKSAPGRKGRPACCCAHPSSQPTPRRSDGPPGVEGRGCQKSLAQQQQLAPSAPSTVGHDHGAANPTLFAPAALTQLGSARPATEINGLHLAAPPPSDLVIVLQRFLI